MSEKISTPTRFSDTASAFLMTLYGQSLAPSLPAGQTEDDSDESPVVSSRYLPAEQRFIPVSLVEEENTPPDDELWLLFETNMIALHAENPGGKIEIINEIALTDHGLALCELYNLPMKPYQEAGRQHRIANWIQQGGQKHLTAVATAQKKAAEAADSARALKIILRNLGLGEHHPAGARYLFDGFEYRLVSHRWRTDECAEILFYLAVSLPLNEADKALAEECVRFNHRFDFSFRKAPSQLDMQQENWVSTTAGVAGKWAELAADLDRFIVSAADRWTRWMDEYAQYKHAYEEGKAVSEAADNRLNAEREARYGQQQLERERQQQEAAAQEARKAAILATVYAPYADTLETLQNLINAVREGRTINAAGNLILAQTHFLIEGHTPLLAQVLRGSATLTDAAEPASDYDGD